MSNLIPVEYQGQRILTTSQLAESYGTDNKHISDNYVNNSSRYTIGKHLFKLEGEALSRFKEGYPKISDSLKFTSILLLWTEKGAWLHAKSLNTDKAWEAYEILVDDYYSVKKSLPKSNVPNEAQMLRAQAMHKNAVAAQAKLMKEIASEFQSKLSGEAVQLLLGGITELLMGRPLLPMPTIDKTYTATEIGAALGVTSTKIGKLANANNLKTDEYGITVLDKSPYSSKQVPAFRYNECGFEKLRELVGESE